MNAVRSSATSCEPLSAEPVRQRNSFLATSSMPSETCGKYGAAERGPLKPG
jgi:hypothetical protein